MNRILGISATAVLPAAVAVRAGVAATVTGAASTKSYGGTAAPAPVVIQSFQNSVRSVSVPRRLTRADFELFKKQP